MSRSFSAKTFLEEDLNRKLRDHPEALQSYNCVYQLEIDDEIWHLDLKHPLKSNCSVTPGEHPKPDCRIIMTEENFDKMIHGKLNVPFALLTGKIKIKGDKALGLKLSSLLS